MADTPPRAADELRARIRLLRIGCFANVILLALFVSVVIVFFANIARLVGASTPAADEAAVRKVLDDQVAAWNTGDLDAFMAGYWNDDALAFTSDGAETSGWKATKERYEKRYKSEGKEMGQLSFSELKFEGLSPNAAVVRGVFTLVLAKAPKPAMGRFTLVFRKFPDGWKITHDHTSSAREPEKK
jgi:beta-aspartyl-peptidase (threonine type)